jgi:hypothetical protein
MDNAKDYAQLADNHSLQKADQWRTLCNTQHIFLWLAWRDSQTDEIKTKAPDIPPQAKKPVSFKRKLPELYDMILYLAVAERILSSRSITINDAKRGVDYLQRYCEIGLRLGVNLKPNHHLAMHYVEIFKQYGPVYAWWLFAFERFNGYLEDVNLNGHAGGVMERTILRSWITKHRMYELVGFTDSQ